MQKYGDRECIGTREILGEEDEVQSSGKVFKKLALGDYKWISYNQLSSMAESFGRGLRLLGQEPGTSIAIYAETRAEWMMSCLGAFSQVQNTYFIGFTMHCSNQHCFTEYSCLHCLHQLGR